MNFNLVGMSITNIAFNSVASITAVSLKWNVNEVRDTCLQILKVTNYEEIMLQPYNETSTEVWNICTH